VLKKSAWNVAHGNIGGTFPTVLDKRGTSAAGYSQANSLLDQFVSVLSN
jgi:hypothetical protein